MWSLAELVEKALGLQGSEDQDLRLVVRGMVPVGVGLDKGHLGKLNRA
jgi:hypothetical protein